MRDLRDMPIVTVEQVIRFREAVFAEIERLQRENEELRKQCDTLEFRAGDALDRAVRAEQENEEVMRQKAYQYQRAKKAEEELAALKAQSTEPVAVIKRNESGQITMQAPDGTHWKVSFIGCK